MATHDELIQLREELKKIQEQTKKSRTRAGIGFGLLLVVLIIAFMYAFVQQVKAEKNADEVMRQLELTDQAQQLAERRSKEAEMNAREAVRQNTLAVEATKALEACRKGKK